MATILESVGDRLVTGSFGTLATNIFLGRMPATPDVCVCVYEYEGAMPLATFGSTATAIDKPRIQIVCRAGRDDYPTARDAAQNIRAYLGAISNTTISDIKVMRIMPIGSVFSLGPDQQDRPRIAFNAECYVGI
jgi:hypothetical protein